jgi:hypothetical protein
MPTSKRSTTEFMSDVIIPIEQNDPDGGNLYVLIKSWPNQSYMEYEEDSSYRIEDWSVPTESSPGAWIEGEHIKLETLSGIIWHGVGAGRLYKAEFEGEKKPLAPRNYFGSLSDYQKSEMEAKRRIDEGISLGIEAKRGRLIRRIKNWRPYLLWSFALDCIERAYSFERDLVSGIYEEGIIFARAYSKYRCGMGGIELEGLMKVSSANKSFVDSLLNKKSQLIKLISEKSELGMTVYLQKALLEAFNPYKPFQIANYVRTAMAWHYMGEYRKEYAYPGITEIPREQTILSRIWYALHKKELEWQVDHLSKLVGD